MFFSLFYPSDFLILQNLFYDITPPLHCNHSPPRSSLNEADFDKVGFYDVFYCVRFFAEHSREGIDTERISSIFSEELQELSVDIIETVFIDMYLLEELTEVRELTECMIITDDFCETIGYTRCTTTTLRDFMRFITTEFDSEDFCTAFDDFCEVFIFVEIHFPDMTKSVTERMAEG